MDPATLLPLSKMAALEELIMQDCYKLAEFVAYASLTARYGFRVLKSLDLRGSPVGDSEVSALGWLPQLEKLWLSARRPKRTTPHAHYADDERSQHEPLHDWEITDSDDNKSTYSPDTSFGDIGLGMGNVMPPLAPIGQAPGSTDA
ncbi:jg27840, partial [Pararge aegeria aegeria]